MESHGFINFLPKVVAIKCFDKDDKSFTFNDSSGLEQHSVIDLNEIYFDGKKNSQAASPLAELKERAKTEPVRAEVVKICDSNLGPNWRAISMFVGSSQAPAHTELVSTYNFVPHDTSLRSNERIVSLGPVGPPKFRLGLGKLDSGEQAIINKNFFFEEGRPMKNRMTEAAEARMDSGRMLNVDLAPVPDYYRQRFPMLRDAKYFTSLVWLGEKPLSSKLNEFGRMVENTRTGNVILLVNDTSGTSTSGVISPFRFENKPDPMASNVRIWFDRKDAYLYGTCLENVNLALFFSNYSTVNVYFDGSDPIPKSALDQIRKIFGPDDKHTYVRAKFVTKGNVLPEDLIFENKETRFHVRLTNYEMKNYLKSNHKLSLEDFEFLVNPPLIATQQQLQPDKTLADKQPLQAGRFVQEVYKAKVLTLKKPQLGMISVEGYMTIDSDKFRTQWGMFKRWNVFIFGQCLEQANLMDFILPTDEFNVELELNRTKGLKVRSAWIGPTPTYRSKRYPPDPNSFPEFQGWLQEHRMRDTQDFFDCVKGKIPITPYFPLLPTDSAVKHLATVHAFYQIPPNIPNVEQKTFGLLRINSGPMEGEILPFCADDTYIMDYNVGYCSDLTRIFELGDHIFCEVRKLHEHEMTKWGQIYSRTCNKDGARFKIIARYTAYLVYRDSRPYPPRAKPAFTVQSEVERNEPLGRWLTNRRMTVQEFTDFVCGPQSSDIGGLSSISTGSQLDLGGSATVDSTSWEQAMGEKYREFVSSIDVPSSQVPPPNQVNLREPPPSFHTEPLMANPSQYSNAPPDFRNNLSSIRSQDYPANPLNDKQGLDAINRQEFSTPNQERSYRFNMLEPDLPNQFSTSLKGPRSTQEYPANPSSVPVNTVPVENEQNNEFLSKAEMLMRRIMNCVTLDDPNIRHIVKSDADLELAMFMSKALVSSIMTFTKSKETAQDPPAVSQLRDNQFSQPLPNSDESTMMSSSQQQLSSASSNQLSISGIPSQYNTQQNHQSFDTPQSLENLQRPIQQSQQGREKYAVNPTDPSHRMELSRPSQSKATALVSRFDKEDSRLDPSTDTSSLRLETINPSVSSRPDPVGASSMFDPPVSRYDSENVNTGPRGMHEPDGASLIDSSKISNLLESLMASGSICSPFGESKVVTTGKRASLLPTPGNNIATTSHPVEVGRPSSVEIIELDPSSQLRNNSLGLDRISGFESRDRSPVLDSRDRKSRESFGRSSLEQRDRIPGLNARGDSISGLELRDKTRNSTSSFDPRDRISGLERRERMSGLESRERISGLDARDRMLDLGRPRDRMSDLDRRSPPKSEAYLETERRAARSPSIERLRYGRRDSPPRSALFEKRSELDLNRRAQDLRDLSVERDRAHSGRPDYYEEKARYEQKLSLDRKRPYLSPPKDARRSSRGRSPSPAWNPSRDSYSREIVRDEPKNSTRNGQHYNDLRSKISFGKSPEKSEPRYESERSRYGAEKRRGESTDFYGHIKQTREDDELKINPYK